MWLFNSSIGRKLVMAITGICLVLFVTFHVLMNSVAIFWPTAYNQVCEFLGANWYALIASAGLAALFIIHIIYAVWLTLQNRKARGADRYAVTSTPRQVEWASKNMLVLGIVILAFLVVHMIQFWSKMQLVELMHTNLPDLPMLGDAPVAPAQGTLFIQMAFSEVWTPIVYIIGFVALWFHMNHGFWSMFQTTGWNGQHWLPRLKKIACWWTTIVVALFVIQVVVFTVNARNNYYTENEALQEQYAEFWDGKAEELTEKINVAVVAQQQELQDKMKAGELNQQKAMEESEEYWKENAVEWYTALEALTDAYEAQCPDVKPSSKMLSAFQMKDAIRQQCAYMMIELPEKADKDNKNANK